jgi:hypothetical protein
MSLSFRTRLVLPHMLSRLCLLAVVAANCLRERTLRPGRSTRRRRATVTA